MPLIDSEIIRKTLKENLPFSLLGEDRCEDLIPLFSTLTYKLGEIVIRQGEPSDGYFIVMAGKARVIDTERDGLTLAVLQKGDGFGEQSLLTGQPSVATVRASGSLKLIKLDQKDCANLLADQPQFETTLRQIAEKHEQFNSLKKLKIFSELKPVEIEALLEQIEMVELNKGDFLFHEGDTGDAAYVVRSGKLQIIMEATNKVLAIERAGSLVGEIALVKKKKRMASARALEDTSLYKLRQPVFQKILPRIQDIVEQQVANAILQYQAFTASPDEEEEVISPQSRRSEHKVPAGLRFRRIECVTVNKPELAGLACVEMVLTARQQPLPPPWRQWTISQFREDHSQNMHTIGWYLEESGLLVRIVRIKPAELSRAVLPAILMDTENIPLVLFGVSGKEVFCGHPLKGFLCLPIDEFQTFWNGELLQAQTVPEFGTNTGSIWRIYARFLPLLRPHKDIIGWILGISIILMLLGLMAPFFTQNIIDKVLAFSDRSMLKLMLLGMICVTIFQLLGSGLRNLLAVTIMQRLESIINARLFHHIVLLPVHRFEKFKVGEYAARFGENRKMLGMISGTGMTLAMDVVIGLFYLVKLFTQNLALTIMGLVFVVAQMALAILSSRKLRANDRQVFETTSENTSFVIDMVSGMQTVKSLASEHNFFHEGMDNLSSKLTAEFTGARFGMLIGMASQALSSGATLCILALGSYKVMGGELTLGEFVAFNAVYGLLMAPVSRLVGVWDQIQEIRISYERINDILEMPVDRHLHQHELADVKGHILFENLYFRYEGMDKDALANLNLEIQPGQKVALVGRSGCGKSTLANLLLGFFQPASGKIYIDGTDIKSLHPSSLLKHIGMVEQRPFLFEGTIRKNIAQADPDLPPDKILAAASISGVKEFANQMPLGLDTRVGEAGMSLSGGQVQRIAIARAIARQPSILILDEATSALDTESESMIQQNLDLLMKERTTLVIAHRLSTIMNADMIVVMDKGRVVETGTHESLMANQGFYYYLYTSGQQAAA